MDRPMTRVPNGIQTAAHQELQLLVQDHTEHRDNGEPTEATVVELAAICTKKIFDDPT